MSAQESLFDTPIEGPLPVRSSDPETSRAAVLQLNVRERQAEVLRAMRHRIVSSTPEEIRSTLSAWGFRQERNEVASRLSEMASTKHFDPPLVRKVGVKRNHRNRPVGTWILTAAGKARARELDE